MLTSKPQNHSCTAVVVNDSLEDTVLNAAISLEKATKAQLRCGERFFQRKHSCTAAVVSDCGLHQLAQGSEGILNC